jgi:hypothetical protein
MRYRAVVIFCAFAALAFAALSERALAQTKAIKGQLIGTWMLVSSTGQRPDGGSTWGPNPKGLLILTAGGRFSSQLMRSDLPKFASNNRLKGTSEENKAIMEGVQSYFGTYMVDEATKTVTLRIESSAFPNWTGTDQKRTVVSITKDELKWINPAPSTGGQASELVWKRAK